MLTRLMTVLGRQPDVVLDHLGNYLELLSVEAAQFQRHLLKKMLAWLVFVLAAGASILLIALGLMLWGAAENEHWLIWAVPLAFMVLTFIALLNTSKPAPGTAFFHVRAQAQADVQLLKQILKDEQ